MRRRLCEGWWQKSDAGGWGVGRVEKDGERSSSHRNEEHICHVIRRAGACPQTGDVHRLHSRTTRVLATALTAALCSLHWLPDASTLKMAALFLRNIGKLLPRYMRHISEEDTLLKN
jgi:hypothetical protein